MRCAVLCCAVVATTESTLIPDGHWPASRCCSPPPARSALLCLLTAARWDDGYEAVRLQDLPFKQLTLPARAFDFDFAGGTSGGGGGGLAGTYPTSASLELEVIAPGGGWS